MDFCVLLKFDKSEFVVVLFMFVELILQEMDLLDRCEDVKQTSVFCVTADSPKTREDVGLIVCLLIQSNLHLKLVFVLILLNYFV